MSDIFLDHKAQNSLQTTVSLKKGRQKSALRITKLLPLANLIAYPL